MKIIALTLALILITLSEVNAQRKQASVGSLARNCDLEFNCRNTEIVVTKNNRYLQIKNCPTNMKCETSGSFDNDQTEYRFYFLSLMTKSYTILDGNNISCYWQEKDNGKRGSVTVSAKNAVNVNDCWEKQVGHYCCQKK